LNVLAAGVMVDPCDHWYDVIFHLLFGMSFGPVMEVLGGWKDIGV